MDDLLQNIKRLLQTIDLMLGLLYHKRNPLIKTVVNGRFLSDYNLREKC